MKFNLGRSIGAFWLRYRSYLGRMPAMLVLDKVLFRLERRRKALLDLHRKAWNGVSILIFEDDSAGTPRKHRINFYVLFFFGMLLVSVPLVALGLFVERKVKQGTDPVEQVENRLVLLNTLKLMSQEKRQLMRGVDEQVREFQGLAWKEDRALLARYAGERYTRFVKRDQPGLDVISRELTELQNLRSRGLVLEETATMALNLIWNRMSLYHMLPRGRPLAAGSGRVTSVFGTRSNPIAIDLTNDEEFHRGIDIATNRGREILATAPGFVFRAEHSINPGYGKFVIIHHGLGYLTLYAHCSEVLVNTGDTVRRGQPIARVGRTGRATGSHVHYEVGLGMFKPIDPLPFIQLK